MKPFLRFLLRFIIGVVSAAALLVLLFWLFLVTTGAVKYPRLGVEYKFHRYERSFETVYQFIDDFDLTPYEVEGKIAPNILITKNDTDSSKKKYNTYIYNGEEMSLAIDDESVLQALDVLFDQAGIAFIVRLREPAEPYVYFAIKEYAGVVYSESGETPTDTPAKVYYYITPLHGNWFYWYHDDD